MYPSADWRLRKLRSGDGRNTPPIGRRVWRSGARRGNTPRGGGCCHQRPRRGASRRAAGRAPAVGETSGDAGRRRCEGASDGGTRGRGRGRGRGDGSTSSGTSSCRAAANASAACQWGMGRGRVSGSRRNVGRRETRGPSLRASSARGRRTATSSPPKAWSLCSAPFLRRSRSRRSLRSARRDADREEEDALPPSMVEWEASQRRRALLTGAVRLVLAVVRFRLSWARQDRLRRMASSQKDGSANSNARATDLKCRRLCRTPPNIHAGVRHDRARPEQRPGATSNLDVR